MCKIRKENVNRNFTCHVLILESIPLFKNIWSFQIIMLWTCLENQEGMNWFSAYKASSDENSVP